MVSVSKITHRETGRSSFSATSTSHSHPDLPNRTNPLPGKPDSILPAQHGPGSLLSVPRRSATPGSTDAASDRESPGARHKWNLLECSFSCQNTLRGACFRIIVGAQNRNPLRWISCKNPASVIILYQLIYISADIKFIRKGEK